MPNFLKNITNPLRDTAIDLDADLFSEEDDVSAPTSQADILALINKDEFLPEQKVVLESLPWGDDPKRFGNIDLRRVAKILDSTHYGLKEIKQKILEFAAAQSRSPGFGKVILLDGKPGVGKTTIAESIAKALKRPLQKINMASVAAGWELTGSRVGWYNASEGLIVKAIKRAGTFSPIILLDEIDKTPRESNYHVKPESALLQIFDSQNRVFTDMFLTIPIDLSGAIFICTSNDASKLSDALRDRLEIIHLSAYNANEKEHILRHYIIADLQKIYKISPKELQFDDSAIHTLVNNSEGEAGVRLIRKQAEAAFLRAVYMLAETPDKQLVFNDQIVREVVRASQPPLKKDKLKADVGVVHTFLKRLDALEPISIEVAVSKGLPSLTVTGTFSSSAVNDVSVAKTALSKSDCIPDGFFANHEIHIHYRNVHEHAAVEGVSLAIAAALFSAAHTVVFPSGVVFCGEIDIYGRLRPLQGVGTYVEQAVALSAVGAVLPQCETTLQASNIKLFAAADLKTLFQELIPDNTNLFKEARSIGFTPVERSEARGMKI